MAVDPIYGQIIAGLLCFILIGGFYIGLYVRAREEKIDAEKEDKNEYT